MLELLDAGLPAPAVGGFTTRSGGVSAPPYDTLDLGRHVGDDPERVQANRSLLRAALGGAVLGFAQQVHGTRVAPLDEPAAAEGAPDGVPGVDGLFTGTPGLALVSMAADCLPLLLAEPDAGVVAAVHAGRAGLARGVVQAALGALVSRGADLARTTAVLGPAICGLCYELPEELADEVGGLVPGSRSTTREGTPSVDLAAGARTVLEAAGVGTVRAVGGCTYEQPERFFSHRRDGRTGRHAGVVRLTG